MRIVHICLSSFFIDGHLYQENELVIRHVADGHDVTVVASTETYDTAGRVTYVQPGRYTGVEGATIIRLPYRWSALPLLARKLRAHPGLVSILEGIEPDVIMFHGCAAWELRNVSRYVRRRPQVIFHIDTHADAGNSARGWFSREILHRRYYGKILKDAMSVSGPLLYVATSAMDFAAEVYGISRERMEFYPLGGSIPSHDDYKRMRKLCRERLNLTDSDILIAQSGKQGREKMLAQSLRAFSRVENPRLRFVIVGVLQEEIRQECETLISADSRVRFLGWQNASLLTELLCGADIYLQPGTQSATMQHSLCCRCAVILADIPSHQPYLRGNGWLVRDEAGIERSMREASIAIVDKMSLESERVAHALLDYRILSKRVLHR